MAGWAELLIFSSTFGTHCALDNICYWKFLACFRVGGEKILTAQTSTVLSFREFLDSFTFVLCAERRKWVIHYEETEKLKLVGAWSYFPI